MTRGQFVIITNNGVYSSCEFNGDMYYEGYGKEVIERLKNVKTVKDFEREVSEFNDENFQYNDDLVLKAQTPIDFSVDYFDNWFSDYLYIKNISNKVNTIVDSDGKSWKIKPNEIKVFYFGEPTNIKEKSIKEAKTVTCISCEKNLNDYRNDPTCTQTWDYADGDTKWYQKSIHACIEDAKKFMKKGYLCYIDGELFDKPDVFNDTSYFKMEIKPKSSAKKSIKESINYKVEGLYFFNFDVGETCSIDLKDAFNADGVISEFYKNENRIYSIVVCSAIDYYFFISYDYRKKKVSYSECFSSYQNAKNTMRDWLKNI